MELITGTFFALIALIYNDSFEVIRAMEVPWEVVKRKGKVSKHTNSVILYAKDSLFKESGVRDIISDFS